MIQPQLKIIPSTSNSGTDATIPESLIHDFLTCLEPVESKDAVLHLFVDAKTSALFCECHVKASKLLPVATLDVPLDPYDQPDYRANREIVADASAFETMKEDALKGRCFSNIVTEFTREFNSDAPLKVIGGQHRYVSIKEAFDQGIDEYHGLKVYFGLSSDQRFDVQLISNTVIAVPTDLYDRMKETMRGPQLREWCQRIGLLGQGEDFSEKRQRGGLITVSTARTFITNWYQGQSVKEADFEKTDTTPKLLKSGADDAEWEKLRANEDVWKDKQLEAAGREYVELIKAQRSAFEGEKKKEKTAADSREKALNYAVLSAWAYVAGLLHNNSTRLERHFGLKKQTGRDPLNAAELGKGKHTTDPDNYRGLGFRTDAKERGRLVELFYVQTDKGEGIKASLIDLAIKKYHAKIANLDVINAEKKP